MLPFLADSQKIFKFLGYCSYKQNGLRTWKDRVASVTNYVCSVLLIWMFLSMVQFSYDSRNPTEERKFVIITLVAFVELHGAHETLSPLKSKITNFFDCYQKIINKSKSHFSAIISFLHPKSTYWYIVDRKVRENIF